MEHGERILVWEARHLSFISTHDHEYPMLFFIKMLSDEPPSVYVRNRYFSTHLENSLC